MASDWARKKAEEIGGPPSGVCAIAAALDEAQERGAQRERWECAHLQELDGSRVARDDDGKPNAWNTQLLIYAAIAARGPMLAPEEEK